MNARQLILGLPTVLFLTAAVAADDPTPCVQDYPPPLTAAGRACVNGGCHAADCGCDACGGGSWWSRTKLGIRRHWFRHWQKQKHLQHPEAPPFFEANWGYHPTCWRQFPPLCNPCPMYGPSGYSAPAEGHSLPKAATPPAPAAPN